MEKAWHSITIGRGGLNTDDDPQGTQEKAYPVGDYTYKLNLRKGGISDTYSGGEKSLSSTIVIPNQSLPEGINKCIGSYEDVYTPSIIFFNYNSNGNHGIYQFFPLYNNYGRIDKLMVSDTLAFQEYWTITGINLVENKLLYWEQGFETTSGDIEGNRPRKINTIKADDVGKFRTYQIIFNHDVFEYPADFAILNIIIYSDSGAVAEAFQAIVPLPKDDYMQFLEFMATAINALSFRIEAEACDCGINITMKQTGEWTMFAGLVFSTEGLITAGDNLYYATNFYPSPVIDDYLCRIKKPPQCEPNLTFMNNAEKKQNLLVGEYFQFAVRHRFDDGEKSVKGAISEIGYVTLPCGYDETASPYNFIRVDFTSDILRSIQFLAVITGVELLVRNGNNGLWKLVKVFDRCELDVTAQYFDFYNDSNYPVLDDVVQAEIQHDVPLIGLGQEFVTNRGFIGGGLIGFDNIPCPEGTLELSYQEDDDCQNEEMATITFKIYIHNPHDVTDPTDAFYQPIYSTDNGGTIVFGGMSGTFIDNVGTNYNQYLYNRGFRVYSAGTEYNTYSVQHAPVGVTLIAGVGNIFDAGDSGKRDAIRDAMLIGQVYSEVTLLVKKGTHIIRIASHLLQDLNDGSPYDANAAFGIWQKTSTYVDNMCQTNLAEIIVTVDAGEVLNLPDCYLMDLKDTTATYSNAYSGYIIDGETDSDQEALFASPRMERQKNLPSIVGGGTVYFSYNNSGRTDHNGFWWGTEGGNGPIPVVSNVRFITDSISPIVIHNSTDPFYGGNLNNLKAGTCTSITTLDVSNEHKPFIIYNLSEDASSFCRTFIKGNLVFSTGAGVIGATVLFGATSRQATTGADGQYSLLVYVDTFNNQRNNYLVYKYDAACCIETPNGDNNFIAIYPFTEGGDYSYDFPYFTSDWILDILGVNVEERLKKRNKVVLGIVYTDGYQFSKVQHPNNWDIYIPFLTEPEGNPGIPRIKWNIEHAPPSWATHYSIVKQKNAVYERQLQFIVGEIKYLIHYNKIGDTEEVTTYATGDANLIELSMDTLIWYKDENPDSIINFIPQEGDRITFMIDADGVQYEAFYDYRILSGEGDNTASSPLKIIIKNAGELPEIFPGTLVELWTPRLQTEEAPYFEIMECYPIVETAFGKVHSAGFEGQTQNLDPDDEEPATGYLKHGDCYVRKRNMVVKDESTDPDTLEYFLRKIESFYINDWDEDSLQLPIGRPFVQNSEWMQLFQRTRVWHSGTYVADGNVVVNDYSRFVPGDYLDIEREYGTIMRLIRVGEVSELLSIHKYKIQPLYVGFKPLYDMTGETVVGKTAEILTPGQAIINVAGTENPESVFAQGNYVYGWSTFFGIWWRYAQNGVQDITGGSFKVKKLATRKSKELLNIDKKLTKVYGIFDRDNGEAIWAFQRVEQEIVDGQIVIPAETISFDEDNNRWEGNYGFYPESLSRLGDRTFAFKNGLMYVLYAGSTANNFFDVQDVSKISLVVNPSAGSEKNYFSNRLTPSLKGWSAELIEILPTDITPEGMKSRISANNYATYRSSLWADFFRDYTDPAYTDELKALFEGRDLMGRAMILTLKNNSTEQIHLNQVDVSFAFAEQTI